jgi:hypothetical protein
MGNSQMERWVKNVEQKCLYLTRANQLLRTSLDKKEKVRCTLPGKRGGKLVPTL